MRENNNYNWFWYNNDSIRNFEFLFNDTSITKMTITKRKQF